MKKLKRKLGGAPSLICRFSYAYEEEKRYFKHMSNFEPVHNAMVFQ